MMASFLVDPEQAIAVREQLTEDAIQNLGDPVVRHNIKNGNLTFEQAIRLTPFDLD